jgi:hypothetical protein
MPYEKSEEINVVDEKDVIYDKLYKGGCKKSLTRYI